MDGINHSPAVFIYSVVLTVRTNTVSQWSTRLALAEAGGI
jgi:hypothetical protein